MRLEIRSRELPVTAAVAPLHATICSFLSGPAVTSQINCTLWTGNKKCTVPRKDYLDDIKLHFCCSFTWPHCFYYSQLSKSRAASTPPGQGHLPPLIFSKARVSHVNSSATSGIVPWKAGYPAATHSRGLHVLLHIRQSSGFTSIHTSFNRGAVQTGVPFNPMVPVMWDCERLKFIELF